MLVKVRFLLTLTMLTSMVYFRCSGQDAPTIVEALNRVARPIETIAPTSPFTDIEFLKPVLQDKNIVALGEATHGTKEFFIYKDRLIRYMVANLGYKTIAFESDFSAMQQLDDYINNTTEMPAMAGGGFPLNQHTQTMLAWLRQYNKDKSGQDRVHIYGLEARGFANIARQISAAMPVLPQNVSSILQKVGITDYNKLDKDAINQLAGVIPTLYKAAGIGADSMLNVHYVKLLEQTASNYLHYKFGNRDSYMFNNANWVLKRSGNQKLIIWAHNGHIAKSALFKQPSLGNLLYQSYGAKYQVVAMDFNAGNVKLFVNRNLQSVSYPEVTSAKAYEFYFKQCGLKNFFINLAEVHPGSILDLFFKKKLDMRMIGGTDEVTNTRLSVSENFDLLVYFDNTTASN